MAGPKYKTFTLLLTFYETVLALYAIYNLYLITHHLIPEFLLP